MRGRLSGRFRLALGRYRTPGWIAVILIAVAVLSYFLVRVSDGEFRDAALGNLFATITGIAVGVPIAIEVNRRHQEREDSERKADESQRSRALYHRLQEELRSNGHALDRFRDAIGETPFSGPTQWDWVVTIADGFSTDAYGDYLARQPRPPFPWEVDNALRLAYSMLTGVARRSREGRAAHRCHYPLTTGSFPEEKGAVFVSALAREAERRVIEANDAFTRYSSQFPRAEPLP